MVRTHSVGYTLVQSPGQIGTKKSVNHGISDPVGSTGGVCFDLLPSETRRYAGFKGLMLAVPSRDMIYINLFFEPQVYDPSESDVRCYFSTDRHHDLVANFEFTHGFDVEFNLVEPYDPVSVVSLSFRPPTGYLL